MKSIVRKSSVFIIGTVYLDDELLVLADLNGATITAIFKDRYNLPDASAMFTKSGTVTSLSESKFQVELTSTDTDTAVRTIYYEVVVTLSTGRIIRSGIETLLVDANVKHL